MPKKDTKPVDEIEVKRVANALGVDLDDDVDEKTEKESDSDKKTDTPPVEEDGRSGEEEKDKDDKKEEDEPDYKKMYSDSTKEFQAKYKPMEDKVKMVEKLSGKGIDSIIEDYENTVKDEKDKDKKDTPAKGGEEVDQDSSLNKRLTAIEQKQGKADEKDKVSAKQIIDKFRLDHEMSDDDYDSKISPLLNGIKEMRKPNGDSYTLDEGLELAFVIANKDNIDTIVNKKIKIKQKEGDLTFSPRGSKASSELADEDAFTEQQKSVAEKMGVSLDKKEE